MLFLLKYSVFSYFHSTVISQRPSAKTFLGMSKLEDDNEIGNSKSSFSSDGRYRDIFPSILVKSKSFGNFMTTSPFASTNSNLVVKALAFLCLSCCASRLLSYL